jgi:hypothetical protein
MTASSKKKTRRRGRRRRKWWAREGTRVAGSKGPPGRRLPV